MRKPQISAVVSIVYPNEDALRKGLENALKTNNVAVGALSGKKGLLALHFWESRTKRGKASTTPAVYLNITGVVEQVRLQALPYVDRANMFELTVHPDNLDKTSFVIQTRMNDPGQGDYAWHGTFQLKKSANKPDAGDGK